MFTMNYTKVIRMELVNTKIQLRSYLNEDKFTFYITKKQKNIKKCLICLCL